MDHLPAQNNFVSLILIFYPPAFLIFFFIDLAAPPIGENALQYKKFSSTGARDCRISTSY